MGPEHELGAFGARRWGIGPSVISASAFGLVAAACFPVLRSMGLPLEQGLVAAGGCALLVPCRLLSRGIAAERSLTSDPAPQRRSSMIARLPILIILAAALCACDDETAEVEVEQPIAFPHKIHVGYFASGRHRREKIEMHLALLGDDEVPRQIEQGECEECHDDLAKLSDCEGCHVIFRDETLRARSDIRPCVGCHRKTWTGRSASIPGTNVCRCCHGAGPRTDSKEERRLIEYLERGEEVQWVQLTSVSPHIHFSHEVHVRHAHASCNRCHEEMSQKDSPPTRTRAFGMKVCWQCHEEDGASLECLTCHK